MIDGEQVLLGYCPYYKLRFYFKQKRLIVLSSPDIMKIYTYTHPLQLTDSYTDIPLNTDSGTHIAFVT